jgi:hypothetical protein
MQWGRPIRCSAKLLTAGLKPAAAGYRFTPGREVDYFDIFYLIGFSERIRNDGPWSVATTLRNLSWYT